MQVLHVASLKRIFDHKKRVEVMPPFCNFGLVWSHECNYRILTITSLVEPHVERSDVAKKMILSCC